jgi:hypothetical protein
MRLLSWTCPRRDRCEHVQPNVIPLNGTAEYRVLPRTCCADQLAWVKRGAYVAQLTVVVSVGCLVVPFVATVGKRANLID